MKLTFMYAMIRNPNILYQVNNMNLTLHIHFPPKCRY